MQSIRLTTPAVLTVAVKILTLSGCATSHPLAAWQDSLSAYITSEGNGDPMVIRDLPDLRSPHGARPGQIIFGDLGRGQRDVQGVFVGHRPVADSVWFFFVVGVMERKSGGFTQLEDLRLVGFSPRGKHLLWRLSPRDPRLPDLYATTRTTTGLLHRGQVHGPAFPHLHDAYELTINGHQARVRERRSGASWALDLNHSRPGAALAAAPH